MLVIYDRYGQAKAEIAAGDSSTQEKSVQGDNILSLGFTHHAYIMLEVNDYVDFEGERYRLMERYAPEQKSGSEWVYDVKLLGIESLIKRFLVIETTDGDAEPVFALTAPARDHVAMVVKCINDGLDHTTDWKVGTVEGSELITIDYRGKYCDEALKEIAGNVGGKAEWWIEGQTVNICRCEHGEEITLGYDNGLTGISPDRSNTAKFYTRLFPVGSTRNIDPEHYGHSRLMLPGGEKCVEIKTEEYGIFDHYEEDSFSGIYPRRIGIVSNVRSEDVTDENGTPFTIYYFRDDTLTFDPNSYELPGEIKRVSFQDGDLAGLGDTDDHYFEVNFNSDTREFEIITIWPYDDDRQLPGENLIPRPGNHYILWNIRMPDEYYPLAEEEFLSAVERYNAEHWEDITVYKAATDHVWVEETDADLYIGRRVRLVSEQYFPETGYRQSRITKITRKVNLPSQMDLEISDALQSGTLERISDSINDARSYARSIGESLSLPDIIRTSDRTLPTDNNLFSARRSQREFISKNTPDRAKKKIIFDEGIDVGNFTPGVQGGTIDGDGNAELLSMVVRLLLSSPRFVDGFAGEGWRIWLENGLSHLTVDKLTVRQIMTVFELLIEKIRSVGGQICVSAANGKIKDVQTSGGHYIITFEQDNSFVSGDLMRCATFKNGVSTGYWVEITGVSGNSVIVPVDEFAGAIPKSGDECVLMGNTGDPKRQNLILISATEDGQPRVDVMDGVSGKNFANSLRARLGNLDGITDNWFPPENQPHGNGLYSDNAYLRGTFLLVTGEDIKTKFEIVEGRITSAIEAVRDDFITDKGYLSNPAFVSGMEKWDTANEAVFFLVGNRWIWANDNVLTKKGDCASVTRDNDRTVVRLVNKHIIQKNSNLRSKPTFAVNSEGQKEALPVYLSFFYRCVKPGKLTVKFENIDKSGFANFNSMEVEEELAATTGYVQYTCDGLWNGTGDFKLSFSGEIYLYMLVLSTDKVEALTHKYRTLFEQSEKLVKIAAQNFDKDGKVIAESGIITTAKLTGLYAIDENGVLRAFVGAGQDGVKIKADHIQLEGIVTANENFKILEDGSIEAKNGKFTGEINATQGTIGGFEIGQGRIGVAVDDPQNSSFGNLAIYKDFFRVGGNNGYVMFGDDVIPGSVGGAFSAVGRIVNEKQNTMGVYGFDQANYGLFINVSGGTKNYGISSNAALLAPAFINTRANLLTFGSGGYKVDFSQHNIILMYYNQPEYKGTEVTLPNEFSVAQQFGMSSLPDDFAAVVTFRVRTGSKNITLKGIYNHNEGQQNYEMAPGDSVTVLITKADGFRYQIINHTS